ncbi:MAG: hypothetical protein AB7O97_02245 [Planctomycetota bacterium]
MHVRNLLASVTLLTALASGQSLVSIGADGIGCGQNGARLDDGSVASADVSFVYDASTARLLVTVENTTPVVPGVASPVITRVYFNLPTAAASGAVLLSQTAVGPTQPQFAFGFDPDAADGQDPNQGGCFGKFNFRLAAAGIATGIAPMETEFICADTKEPLLRTSTFEIELSGRDVHGLSSEAFAASMSRNPSLAAVNVAVKFEGAGCEGSGTLGNGDKCRIAVFTRGNPTIGNTVMVCVEGGNKCRSFLGVSPLPGPTDFKKFVLPIGQPVLFTYDFGFFPPNGHEFCLPLTIPLSLDLVGLTFYWTSLTHPYQLEDPYSFAPAYAFTIGGLPQ